MEKISASQIRYSPSDLVTFSECQHASFLDKEALNKSMETAESSATAKLLEKKGLEHEKAYLERLKNEGKAVIEISKNNDLQSRVDQTIDAMNSGKDVVYQAVLIAGQWRGDVDFLIKCDTPSIFGDFSYEPLDAKWARTEKPKYFMQLCAYAELLTVLQDLQPVNMHLFLADGEKHTYQVADYFDSYSHAKKDFEMYIQNQIDDSYPYPCERCNLCHWREKCKAQWEKDDHLSRVFNIRHSQVSNLEKSGIKTVASLASTTEDATIPNLDSGVFLSLRAQAILQHHKNTTSKDKYEIIESPPDKGFSCIPTPNEGDLFFDMEGDPFYPDGLEYLFGIYYLKGDKNIFKPFWAHSREEEKEAFKCFMDFLSSHLAEYPHAHIYHYHNYETIALKQLARRHDLCEGQLDKLLRDQKFVDLYRVVIDSIRISEPKYSIKNLEIFYMDKRTDEVTAAMDSIVVYNEWRETRNDELLQRIANYNETDCFSTYLLRNWLLDIKHEAAA